MMDSTVGERLDGRGHRRDKGVEKNDHVIARCVLRHQHVNEAVVCGGGVDVALRAQKVVEVQRYIVGAAVFSREPVEARNIAERQVVQQAAGLGVAAQYGRGVNLSL